MGNSGFRHEALIYKDSDELLTAAVPFLRAGLEAGEPAMVAVSRTNTALLEGELGVDSDEVGFLDMEDLGRNPARIIPFWQGFIDENGGRPVRGIGEPVWPGREVAEIDECRRHESLLNVAFAESPPWSLLCPYDASGLDDEVLEGVGCSHRVLAHDAVVAPSDHYVEGADPFAGELPARPPRAERFEFERPELVEVRRRVKQAADDAGGSRQAVADLVLAASELASNSCLHGGGHGVVHLWGEPGRLTVEVEDSGSIEEPLVGRLRPVPTQERGRGLWIANQLCDLVRIRSGASGTTVRIQSALT